jgi:hypothetical protein
MAQLGMDHETLAAISPRLIYASLKGFLPDSYDKRLALAQVVQMMSGLAYMTGPSGRLLRAGISIIDITGGMLVESALYESAGFLMSRHLAFKHQCIRRAVLRVIPLSQQRSCTLWCNAQSEQSAFFFFVVSAHQSVVGIVSEGRKGIASAVASK